MFNVHRVCVSFTVLIGVAMFACNDSTPAREQPIETHAWLDVCSDDANCGAGMVCRCGVCSKLCAEQRDCAGFAATAVCKSTFPGDSSLCDVHTKVESFCALQCETASDCRPVGERRVCAAGMCRRASLDSLVDGSLLDCDEQYDAIDNALQPILAQADRSCQTESDCESVRLLNACYGRGCPSDYVSKTAADQIRAELSSLEDKFCPTALRAGCVLPKPVSCPLQRHARCVAGSCEEE